MGRASRPLRTQGTGKPPAHSPLRRANHAPPGRLRGVRQRGSLVSSHTRPESQGPTQGRCPVGAHGGVWGKEQTQCPGPESFQTRGGCRVVLRPLPAYARGDAGGPCGPGCLSLRAAVQSLGGQGPRWSPGPQAGGQGQREPLKHTNGRGSCSDCSLQPRASPAGRGHHPFCRKILQLP